MSPSRHSHRRIDEEKRKSRENAASHEPHDLLSGVSNRAEGAASEVWGKEENQTFPL